MALTRSRSGSPHTGMSAHAPSSAVSPSLAPCCLRVLIPTRRPAVKPCHAPTTGLSSCSVMHKELTLPPCILHTVWMGSAIQVRL